MITGRNQAPKRGTVLMSSFTEDCEIATAGTEERHNGLIWEMACDLWIWETSTDEEVVEYMGNITRSIGCSDPWLGSHHGPMGPRGRKWDDSISGQRFYRRKIVYPSSSCYLQSFRLFSSAFMMDLVDHSKRIRQHQHV